MNRRVVVVAVTLVVAALTAGALHTLKARELALEEARLAEAQAVMATQKEVAKRVEELENARMDLKSKIDLIEHLKDAPPVQVYLKAAAAAGSVQGLEIQGDSVEITVADAKALDRFTTALEQEGLALKVTPLPAPAASPKSLRASVVVTRTAKTPSP